MQYTLENDKLKIQAKTLGGALCSVVEKATGRECLWQPDPSIWAGQAPLLFPYCGRIAGEKTSIEGKDYPAPQHGFARITEFSARQEADALRFVMDTNTPGAKKYFPYDFLLEAEYRLQGESLLQTITVTNTAPAGGRALPCSVGFHPGFTLPFEAGRATADYEIVFAQKEAEIQVVLTPDGLVSGETTVLAKDIDVLPLHDDIFQNGSICMKGLASPTLALRDKVSGKAVTVDIAGFPYVLIWSPQTQPVRFVCIEPWQSLPDPVQPYGEFNQKPGLMQLAPGETNTAVLRMTFS